MALSTHVQLLLRNEVINSSKDRINFVVQYYPGNRISGFRSMTFHVSISGCFDIRILDVLILSITQLPDSGNRGTTVEYWLTHKKMFSDQTEN